MDNNNLTSFSDTGITEKIAEKEKQKELERQNTYDKLLSDFSESREELKKMLGDLEECKNTVLKSVCDSNDYRNKYAREERLKTLSTFFGNMLQVRQEYNRSIQAEIELRRKLDKNDSNEMEVDIRQVAKQILDLNKS